MNDSGWLYNDVQNIQQGKIVGSFAFGNQELYTFMDNNPAVCEHNLSIQFITHRN